MRRCVPEQQQPMGANLSGAVYPSLAAGLQESFQDTLARVVTACMEGLKRDSPALPACRLLVNGQPGQVFRARLTRL